MATQPNVSMWEDLSRVLFGGQKLVDGVAVDQSGMLGPTAQLLGTGFGIWQGMEQLDLANKQFDATQRNWEMNYQNQRQLTNQQLMDRQNARYAANPNAYARPDSQWQQMNLVK